LFVRLFQLIKVMLFENGGDTFSITAIFCIEADLPMICLIAVSELYSYSLPAV
jgi:hypothetical protein